MGLTVNNLFRSVIDCPLKATIDTSINITVTLKDFNGDNINGRLLPVIIITPSGTSTTLVSSMYGKSNVTVSYTPTEFGLYTIVCHNTKKQFLVNGWKSYALTSVITLYWNETKVICKINGSVSGTQNTWTKLSTIPDDYSFLRPSINTFAASFMRKGDFQINTGGEIYYRNYTDSSGSEYTEASWARKDVVSD